MAPPVVKKTWHTIIIEVNISASMHYDLGQKVQLTEASEIIFRNLGWIA